jgi:hypothetical protein
MKVIGQTDVGLRANSVSGEGLNPHAASERRPSALSWVYSFYSCSHGSVSGRYGCTLPADREVHSGGSSNERFGRTKNMADLAD